MQNVPALSTRYVHSVPRAQLGSDISTYIHAHKKFLIRLLLMISKPVTPVVTYYTCTSTNASALHGNGDAKFAYAFLFV